MKFLVIEFKSYGLNRHTDPTEMITYPYADGEYVDCWFFLEI